MNNKMYSVRPVLMLIALCCAFSVSVLAAPERANQKEKITMSEQLDNAIKQVQGISDRVTKLETAAASVNAEDAAKVQQLCDSIADLDRRVTALETPATPPAIDPAPVPPIAVDPPAVDPPVVVDPPAVDTAADAGLTTDPAGVQSADFVVS